MATLTNPYIMLLDEEHRLLKKTRDLREKLVDNFIEENGLTTKTGEMRVINELLNSLDTNVTSVVDLRLKNEETKQSEDLTDAIVSIFNKISDSANSIDIKNKVIDVGERNVPDDVVPGEDQIEYQELDMGEILPPVGSGE